VDASAWQIGEVAWRLSSPELVDRSEQLAALDAAWSDVVSGVGRVAVVVGEAGIGKTRLVDEFTGRCSPRARVLRGSCVHVGGEAMPLAPFRSTLTALLDEAENERWEPAALFDTVARRLAEVTRYDPVLLVVEDLHWADRSTLDLTDYLARVLRNWSVLLLVNLRSDPAPEPAIEDVVLELGRLPHTVRLALPRLTPEGVTRQMHSILGHPPEESMAERVVARSGGVPFLVEELTASEVSGEHGVPEHLHDLLLHRTRGLSADASAVLRAAALAAPGVDDETLGSVSGMGGQRLRAGLAELVESGLLTVDRDRAGYAFRHALLREAVGGDLLPREAADLHHRYAQLLDARTPVDPRTVIQAAYHWWRTGDLERAYWAALGAADSAHSIGASAEELLLLQRALDLYDDRLHKSPEHAGGPDRPDLLARAARVARRTGELPLAHELFEQARHALAPGADPALVARILADEAGLVESMAEPPGVDRALHELLAALPPEPSAARTYVLAGLYLLAYYRRREDPQRLWSLLQEALAGPLDDVDPLWVAALRSQAAGHLAGQPGGAEEALAQFDRAQEFAEKLDDVLPLCLVLNNRASVLILMGRPEEAAATVRSALEITGAGSAAPVNHDYLVMTLTDALIDTGELDDAQRLLEDTLRVDRPNMERGGLYTCLGQVRARLGQWDEAAEAAETAHHRLDASDPDPQFLVPLATLDAELALAGGAPDQALRIAAGCCRDHDEHVPPAALWPLLHVAARAAAPHRPPWLLAEVRLQSARLPQLPDRAEAVLAALDGREATPPRRAQSSPTDLTPREREVLELVAAGRSNNAIAAELVISPKTASVHVSHILDKLMVSSRGEAAAVAWRRGLVQTDDPGSPEP
jgi:DNA-binding CsgD family transcriptional regulator/tetratricopeptide (TPR) repeat protein